VSETIHNTAESQQARQNALMAMLGFAPADLEDNRAGHLSELQRYTLRARRRRAVMTGLVIVLAVVFIATLFLFLGGQRDSFILTLIGIIVTICNAALSVIFARHWFRLSADIRGGVVRASHGTLERVIKPVNRRVVNYMIRVDNAEVFVSKEAFELFEHRMPYVLYRAPHTGTLLAAERLES
jgi:hypothetical protein